MQKKASFVEFFSDDTWTVEGEEEEGNALNLSNVDLDSNFDVQRKARWITSNPFSATVDGALCLGGRSNYCMDGSGNTSSM